MTHLTPNNLDVRVSDALIEGGNVSYRVCLMHPLRNTVTVSYVMRRFSDLEPVMKRLKGLPVTTSPLPAVPEKKFFGSTAPEFVESRRVGIEAFLRAVAYNQDLCTEKDYLDQIGYPPPPAALASAGIDLPNTTSVASAVGTGGAKMILTPSKAGQSGGATAAAGGSSKSPSNLQALAATVPWVRGPPQQISAEQDLAAAQGWIRGTQFRLVRHLPPLSYRRNCKTNFLLEDPTTQPNATRLILSVYTPDPALSIAIPDEKKLQVIVRTLSGPLGANHKNIAAPVLFTADKGRMFVVRRFYPHGSLLDMLFKASDPLVEASRKFGTKPKPLPMNEIAIIGRQLLLLCKQCHEFNIPLGSLHLGNLFLAGEKASAEKSVVVLGDMESSLLGLTSTPPMLPVCGREEIDEAKITHVDILRVGIILLSLGVGMPLRAEVEVQLLRCCGTPWMPSWNPPAEKNEDDEDEDDEDETATQRTAKSKKSTATSSTKKEKIPDELQPPPSQIYGDIQEPLLSLLKFIFLPGNKAEIDVLLKHSFFKTAKLPKAIKSILVDPTSGEASETGFFPSLTGLKKKDVELFSESHNKWQALLEHAESIEKKRLEGRQVAKDLKKIGKEKRIEAMKHPEMEPEPNVSRTVVAAVTSPTTRTERKSGASSKPSPSTSKSASPAQEPALVPPARPQQTPLQQAPPPPTPTPTPAPAPAPAPTPTPATTTPSPAAATTSPASPPPMKKNPMMGGMADLLGAIRSAGGSTSAAASSSTSGGSSSSQAPAPTPAASTPAASSSSSATAPAPPPPMKKNPMMGGMANLLADIKARRTD